MTSKDRFHGRRSFVINGIPALTAAGFVLGHSAPARAADEDCATAFKREDFEEYIRIFNLGDSDAYARYYHDDVVLERGDLRLEGKPAILEFYRGVHASVRQTIEVLDFIARGDRFVVELMASFEAFADWSHPIGGSMKKGARRKANTFVHYRLVDGLYARIRSAQFRTQEY